MCTVYTVPFLSYKKILKYCTWDDVLDVELLNLICRVSNRVDTFLCALFDSIRSTTGLCQNLFIKQFVDLTSQDMPKYNLFNIFHKYIYIYVFDKYEIYLYNVIKE
jgi:hypothetical protein